MRRCITHLFAVFPRLAARRPALSRLALPWLAAAFAMATVSTAHAQVGPAATGRPLHIWAGGEYSNFKPDWGLNRITGAGVWTDIAVGNRYGLEGEARWLTFNKPAGLTEKSYLAGLYYTFYRWHAFNFNAKGLGGLGDVNYTDGIGYGSYFEYALGGDAEYRLSRKLKIRADYEYQFMPSAPGLPGYPSDGMDPNGISAGVSYRIF